MLYKNSTETLTERDYYNFVFRSYKPSIYESKELDDDRFYEGTYYSHVCRTRCYLVYREIINRLSLYSKVIDIGFYPGTIIRQLKILLNNKIYCYGVGQKVNDEFQKFMAPYVEECANLEFDPFYLKCGEDIRIPFEDATFDAVVATEILEHLISPLEMISEGSRILKTGGFFIISTPNVSHIGAVLKLIRGRSNYERLDRSPMYLQNDPWRAHCRFYDKKELKVLFQRNGLELVSHSYYRELGWAHAKWHIFKRIMVNVAGSCFPLYREGHFAVFQKQNV